MTRTRACYVCDQRFVSQVAFAEHLLGTVRADRRCLSVEEMRAAGMSINAAGIWMGANRKPIVRFVRRRVLADDGL